MTPISIYGKVLRYSGAAASFYDYETDFFPDVNSVKDYIWNKILTNVNSDYGFAQWSTSTSLTLTAGLNQYFLPPYTSTQLGLKKLRDVNIAWNTTPYNNTSVLQFYKASEVQTSALPAAWSYYQLYQDLLNPIYYCTGNCFYIAPTPTITVPNGLVITGTTNIPDYTDTTQESQMGIPNDFEDVIAYGVVCYVYDMKTMADEATYYRGIFSQKLTEMLMNMGTHVIAPFTNQYPDVMAQQLQWFNSNQLFWPMGN